MSVAKNTLSAAKGDLRGSGINISLRYAFGVILNRQDAKALGGLSRMKTNSGP